MWTSPGGSVLTDSDIASIDLEVLAVLYDSEPGPGRGAVQFNATFRATTAATRLAWQYNYRNPRTASTGDAATA